MSKNQEILLTNSAVDFLKEEIGGGGTTVIANPELSGDEPNLEGLEVDGNKYKVPQGESIEYIELSTSSGTLNYEQIQKLTGGNYIKYNNTVLIPNGYEQQGGMLGGSRTYYFASTISNDVYLSMSFTLSLPIPPDATANYTITEVSVGGSELGETITINSTNFEAYDTYFFAPINSDNTLYRVGLVFKHKTTKEYYIIVCTTDENVESWDWDDPNNFQHCISIVRGGDLVLYGSGITKIGVVSQYTDSQSTYTEVKILK